jgi:hypothetical protein
MDTSIAHPGAPYDPITSPLLRSAMFEKLDKDYFVKSFIESQKHHATIYAVDGKGLLATWDGQSSGTPKQQKPSGSSVRSFGFDTPVLKPRVAKPRFDLMGEKSDADFNEDAEQDKKLRGAKSSRLESKPKKKAAVQPASKSNKENMQHPSSIPKTRKSSKKRVIQADSDDEHAARESSQSFTVARMILYMLRPYGAP